MPRLTLLLLISAAAAQTGYENIKQANNLFAPDIYKQIVNSGSGNVVVSPLSAFTILTLLHSGTEGQSAQELGTALHLPDNKDQIRQESRNLITDFRNSQITIFQLANGVFAQKGFVLNETFLKVATQDFFAKSQELDFAQNEEAAEVINTYVEDNTNHLIKNLVDPNALNDQTRLVLVNALRFKANWSFPFSLDQTTKDDFFTPGGVVKVDTLHLTKHIFNYYKSESLGAEFLELPFQSRESSFVIALPRDKTGLGSLEKQVSEVFVSSIKFESRHVDVSLPKFKIDFSVDFLKVLQGLGVHKIFDAGTADLSGIAGKKGDLYVSAVFQKAYIDLNEGGVEAAAATYIGVSITSIGPEPINFVVDRPFLFFIKHKGVIPFIGSITDPKY